MSIVQQFGASAFYTVVRWHKLGEVDNECTLHICIFRDITNSNFWYVHITNSNWIRDMYISASLSTLNLHIKINVLSGARASNHYSFIPNYCLLFFIIDETVILRSIFLRGTSSLCRCWTSLRCVDVCRISKDIVICPWPRSNTFVKFMWILIRHFTLYI